MAANTKLIDIKNLKGEIIGRVRGQSLYDALYAGGVPAEYITGSTKITNLLAKYTLAQLTEFSETR